MLSNIINNIETEYLNDSSHILALVNQGEIIQRPVLGIFQLNIFHIKRPLDFHLATFLIFSERRETSFPSLATLHS